MTRVVSSPCSHFQVKARREGRSVYYRVQPRGMKPLVDWIAHYTAFWTQHLERLERLLEKMDE